MPSGDPFLAFGFSVEIQQHIVAGFSEVSGLIVEAEVETFREGGVNDYERQLPAAAKFPSRLVLKRGLGDIEYLWQWYEGILMGRIVRRDVSIRLHDSQNRVVRSWNFRQACPVKWSGPELRAASSAVAFESLELIHRGLVN